MVSTKLRERIRSLPASPGVYLFRDKRGNVLYVGKARNLKARVTQYMDPHRLESGKRALVTAATDVDIVATNNEAEALALEATLIQQHEPAHNVRLVDDSNYLYIRISRETYPTVEFVRRVRADGAWYRGPYPSASAVRATLREARKVFPWCSNPNPGERKKACFAYHLGLCPGVCVGKISLEEYQEVINRLKRFFDGDVRETLTSLRQRMVEASGSSEYERAARLRDAITAIEQALAPQYAVTTRRESLDALAVARSGTRAVVTVLSVRAGRVTGTRSFPLAIPSDTPPAEILRSFLISYAARTTDGARELLLPEPIEDAELLRKHAVRDQRRAASLRRITVPRRGWKRRLFDLARRNAEEALARATTELTSPASLQHALKELAQVLRLQGSPRRIEAYDISNIQGTLATGSMVVFTDGKPQRSAYRKFKVVRSGPPDDVAMMREVVSRRFSRHVATHTYAGTSARGAEWPLPDLLIVDGGKGQLNAATSVLEKLRLAIPAAALAKREEELFIPNRKDPIVIARTSPALFLLQRIRDEAHRFTLSYHQLLRKKRMTRSMLEEIPGVGDATRKKLLREFGSLRGIRQATLGELTAVVGSQRAEAIANFLARGTSEPWRTL